MAITFRAATGLSAAQDVGAPWGDLTYTLPTGHQALDLLIAFYGGKPYNTVPGTPSGYTAQSGGADGTTSPTAGAGSVYAVAFTKTHSGTESNPVSTMPATYNPSMIGMIALESSIDGDWTISSCKGSDSTTTGTSVSITGDATLGYTTGDWIVVQSVGPINNSDSALSITVPGCVVGTVTQRLSTVSTTTGNDGAMRVWTAQITSGTASGAPTVSFTSNTTPSNGQAVFLRVTEPSAVTTSRISTETLEVLATGTADSRLSTASLETLAQVNPDRRVAASGVAVLSRNDDNVRRIAASGVAVLVPATVATVVSGSETHAITVTETSDISPSFDVTDTLSISLTESSSVDDGSGTAISGSETFSLSFTESTSLAITAELSASDSWSLTVTESSSLAVTVAQAASDSSALTISETSDVVVPPAATGYIGWGIRI